MSEITEILHRVAQGDQRAVEQLTPLVYQQLRRIAQNQLSQENDARRWDATELVHEAYLRLIGAVPISWQDRAHFFATAAQAMRRVLIDHARQQKSLKRGGQIAHVDIPLDTLGTLASDVDLLALDEALNNLKELNERQAKLVELRFFGGLSENEAASLLGVSRRTVAADWAMARAWLFRELNPASEGEEH